MDELKQMKTQLWAMIAVGLCVTVMAATRQNTVLAIIIFVAQGTLGSVLNAKYRNEVFRIIEERDPRLYNDLQSTAALSPKAAEQRGMPYPDYAAELIGGMLRVQTLNKWMPIIEVLLFFVIQVALFSNIG